MDIEIFSQPFELTAFGFSGVAENKDYVGKAFQLMDKMWTVVKSNGLKNKGLNIWIYEPGEKVFAGVELDRYPEEDFGLLQKTITIPKYARYKHTGPYSLIKQSGQLMSDELKKKGFEVLLPYIEIYGHWTNDESKLETDLIMTIR